MLCSTRVRVFEAFLICCICVTFLESTPQKFIDSGIVPHIVTDVPRLLKVYYDGTEIELGSEVERSLTKNPPTVEYDANQNDIYALIMIDPDAPFPQKPIFSQFLHWLLENIPGSKTEDGEVLANYVQPSPPEGSDPHRYVLFTYKQPKSIPHAKYDGERKHFNISEYVSSQNFQGPTAGFFFYVKHE